MDLLGMAPRAIASVIAVRMSSHMKFTVQIHQFKLITGE